MRTRSLPISLRFRVGSYVSLAVWSAVLVIFAVYRILYTLSPQNSASLNTRRAFYDPVLIELTFVAALSPFFAVLMLYILLSQERHSMVSRNWFEITLLSMLWLLWLGGAAAAMSIWNNLNYCIRNPQCNVLATIIAFAWLGWITVTALLLPSLFFTIRAGSWDEHLFEKWVLRMPPEPPPKYVEQNPAAVSGAPSAWSYALDKYKRPPSQQSGASGIVPYLGYSDRGSSFTHSSGA